MRYLVLALALLVGGAVQAQDGVTFGQDQKEWYELAPPKPSLKITVLKTRPTTPADHQLRTQPPPPINLFTPPKPNPWVLR